MLSHYLKKVNSFLRAYKNDIFIALLIFLTGFASFGLGQLSILWSDTQPITIEDAAPKNTATARKRAPAALQQAVAAFATQGTYVASKSGAAYHYPWCSGAKRIKEENKVWFETIEDAKRAGYRPAANCPDLE